MRIVSAIAASTLCITVITVTAAELIGNGKVNPHSGSNAAGTGNGNKCYVR